MNLYEVAPTLHWTPTSTDVRSTATIKTDKDTYELVVRCNKSVADHLIGWVSKVIVRENDVDKGRYVELTNKANRESFVGVSHVLASAKDGIVKQVNKQDLLYVYMFSTKPSRREVFEKLAKQVAKKLEWEVYQDRNYFLIYKPTLKVLQPD